MKPASLLAALFALSALALAACGGGSSGGPDPVINPTATPTSKATATPTPTPTPISGATGVMSVNGSPLANAKVAFSCGCSSSGGTATTDASGNYTITQGSPQIPPPGTYTIVPGRNYMIVAAGSPGETEAWTMMFLGSIPAHNVYLTSANTTDAYTAAAALYIFYSATSLSDPLAYDHWNMNTIISWENTLRASGGNNAAEKQLLADIVSAQQSGSSLFPAIPVWDPDSNPPFQANATIAGDLKAVQSSGDKALPTPCPSTGCTGTPQP
jgi:hypothetical protein